MAGTVSHAEFLREEIVRALAQRRFRIREAEEMNTTETGKELYVHFLPPVTLSCAPHLNTLCMPRELTTL